MSANINIANGKASLFVVREKAWHGLGQVLENCPTSEEAISEAGLNYEVKKFPNFVKFPTDSPIFKNEYKPTKGSFSTVRMDTGETLGDRLGNKYTVVQNRDAFKFFDAIVGEGEAIYETAGALGCGETIFITAKLPSYIRVGNKDDIEKYLLLTMAHDGSSAIQAMFTPIRVVCNNTLNAAIQEAGQKIKIKHTANAQNSLDNAHKILGITNLLSDELNLIFNVMARKKITDAQVKGFIGNVFSPEQKKEDEKTSKRRQEAIDSCLSYYQDGGGQSLDSCRGTVWGAFNAVTGYFQNVKQFKTDEQKFENNLYGGNFAKMQKAFILSKQLVKI